MGIVPNHSKDCRTIKSFPCKCRNCGQKVIFWSCSCGSKVFFELGSDRKKHECDYVDDGQPFYVYSDTIKCPHCNTWMEEKLLISHIEFHHPKLLWKRKYVRNEPTPKPTEVSPNYSSRKSVQKTSSPKSSSPAPSEKNAQEYPEILIMSAWEKSRKSNGYVLLNELAMVLYEIDSKFKPSQFGYKKLLPLVQNHPKLEISLNEKNVHVVSIKKAKQNRA